MIVGVTGLYTGSEVEPGYSIIRCLNNLRDPRIKLLGLSSNPVFGCAFRKDLAVTNYLVPPLSADNIELHLRRLKEIKSEGGLDVLIPATDKETAALVPYAGELGSVGIMTLLPSVSALNAVSDKDGIARFQSKNILTMPSLSLESPDTTGEQPAAIILPLAKNPIAAPILHRQATGNYYSAAVLADRRKKIVAMAAIHQLLISKGGSTWIGKIVSASPIGETAKKLAVSLKWVGPLTINFFVSEKGRIFIMGVHPGLPDWINFVADAGLNFPLLMLGIIGGKSLPAQPDVEAGGFFVRMSVDMVTDMRRINLFSIKGVLSQDESE